jgi:WD40 repeat protein
MLKGHEKGVFCLALLPDGNLASGSEDETIRIWDMTTGETLKILREHKGTIFALTILSNETLVSGGEDCRIILWNILNGNKIFQLEGHTDMISCLLVLNKHSNNNNNLLASGSYDKSIRIWNTNKPNEPLKILIGHENEVLSLVNLSDGNIASGSKDKTIRIWNITSGDTIKILNCDYPISSLASLKENQLISSPVVVIWDLLNDDCKLKQLYSCLPEFCYVLLVILKDQILAAGYKDGFIRLWDIERGVVLKEIKHHSGRVWSLTMLSDGRLASSSDNKIIKIWDINSEIKD